MTSAERNLEAIRGCIVQSMHGIGPEVLILALFTVAERGTGGLELSNRIPDRFVIDGIQLRILEVSGLGNRCKQFQRSRNASNRLCQDCQQCLSVPGLFLDLPSEFFTAPRLRGNSAALPNGTDRTDRKDDHGTFRGLLNLESRQFNLMHCHRCKIAFKVRAFPEKLLRVTRQ